MTARRCSPGGMRSWRTSARTVRADLSVQINLPHCHHSTSGACVAAGAQTTARYGSPAGCMRAATGAAGATAAATCGSASRRAACARGTGASGDRACRTCGRFALPAACEESLASSWAPEARLDRWQAAGTCTTELYYPLLVCVHLEGALAARVSYMHAFGMRRGGASCTTTMAARTRATS